MENEKRLIYADALLDEIRKSKDGHNHADHDILMNHHMEHDTFMDLVDNAPTVDAVELVHAEWLDIRFDPMWRSMLATCSHCKVRGEVRVKGNECGFAVPDSDYCPNCGAKMDGKVEYVE